MHAMRNSKFHVWKNYFRMIFQAGLPWPLMAVCFLLSIGNAQLSLTFANQMSVALTSYQNLEDVVGPLFLLFGIGMLTVILKVAGAYLQAIVTAKVDRNMQRYAVGQVFYLKTREFEDGDPREMITRLTEDTAKNSNFLVDLMINEIPRLYYIIVATVQVAGIGRPELTISLLLTIPVIFLGAFISGRITFKNRNKIQGKIAALTARLAEKIDNIETIKSYHTEEEEIVTGDEVIMDLDRVKKQGAVVDQANAFIKNMMWFLPLLLIIIPPALLLFNGQITQAEFYAYILIATTFRTYTSQHLDLWIYLKDAQGATLRLSGLLSLDNEKPDGAPSVPSAGNIVFQDVSFSYGENTVLDRVSFTIEKGKKTALVGLSGSGKSTVLNLIEKFYEPAGGSILLDGQDISALDYSGYRSLFSYLPQNAPAFSGTVREMLAFAAKEPRSDEALLEALEKVGLLEDIEALGGLDYEIGFGGEKLSGGQRQKLCVAGVLLGEAEYVLLDEATSAMDAGATAAVQKAIDEACRGRTQIAAAHDLSTVQNADKILVFSKGQLVAEGSHEELLKSCPLYHALQKEVRTA